MKRTESLCSTPSRHLGVSPSCPPHRPDQTRHASAVLLLFLSSWSNSYNLKTTPLRNLYGSRNDLARMLRFPSPPMPPLVRRSVRRSCLSLLVTLSVQFSVIFFFCLIRFGRSSRSCLSSLSTLFSRFCCCTTFIAFSIFLVIRAVVYLLSMHMFIPYTLLWTVSFHRGIICIYVPCAPHYLPTPSAWFGFVSGLASLVDCVLHVQLDRIGSLRLGVESLAS